MSLDAVPMKRVNVDPQGDVRLITSDPDGSKTCFIVNSSILKAASKVFTAMFSINFAERQALKCTLATERTDVSLPDDDTIGMKIMLEYLHFHPRPDRLEVADLAKLASAVDKYQCQSVFHDSATAWILRSIERQGLALDIPEYLGISIAFQSAEAFQIVADGVALTWSRYLFGSPMRSIIKKTQLSHMAAEGVIGQAIRAPRKGNSLTARPDSIESRANDMHDELTTLTADDIKSLTQKGTTRPTSFSHNGLEYCKHDETVIANLYRSMQQEGVFPCRSGMSLIERLRKMCAIVKFIKDADDQCGTPGMVRGCTACAYVSALERNVMQKFFEVLEDQGPICYRTSDNSGECAKRDAGACKDRHMGEDDSRALYHLFGFKANTRLLEMPGLQPVSKRSLIAC